MGLTRENPVPDSLTVQHLDNWLFGYFKLELKPFSIHGEVSKVSSSWAIWWKGCRKFSVKFSSSVILSSQTYEQRKGALNQGSLIQGRWYVHILSLLASTSIGMCTYYVQPLQVHKYVHEPRYMHISASKLRCRCRIQIHVISLKPNPKAEPYS